MLVIRAQEMRDIDKRAIEDYKIPGIVLMENAALAVLGFMEKTFKIDKNDSILISAGTGNNGGDGYALARLLVDRGYRASLFIIGDREPKGDAGLNLRILERLVEDQEDMGDGLSQDLGQDFSGTEKLLMEKTLGTRLDIKRLRGPGDLKGLELALASSSIVVDAILGTGLDRPVEGLFASAIDIINNSGRRILSVDIPSGIHGDSGRVMGTAIKASATVTFAYLKRGQVLYPAREHVGSLYLAPISIPSKIARDIGADKVFTLDKKEAARLLKDRPRAGHKGSFGKLAILAGSTGLTGAAYLTSIGALRSGAGLVTLGIPASLNPIMEAKLTEVMTLPLEDRGLGHITRDSLPDIMRLLEGKDSVAIGPGLGKDKDILEILRNIFGKINISIVIDADGLNHISADIDLVAKHQAPVIMTPHPGEMARLMDMDIKELLSDPIQSAQALAKRTGAIALLKGAATVIADPSGRVYINRSGNEGMAKGGSGDLLTGIVAALLAQAYDPFDAAVLACFVHGLAGDLAAKEKGRLGMTPDDMALMIARAFKDLYEMREKAHKL